MSTLHIGIAGAGLAGRTLAWRLLRAGCRVSLFDARSRGDLATASMTAAAMLSPLAELAVSDEAEPVRQALIDFRAAGQARLRERFERAKAEGDLPETAKPDALAAFVMAVTHGMAIQAKAGFTREMLDAVADQALSGWPGK